MEQPKVSVIIPVYNTEKYLSQCLDSVVNQSLKEIEIICIDDGSTDSSLEILQEYAEKDSRVKIIQQQHQYAGVARNLGMNYASGKYLFFMDSDDFCEKNLLEKTVERAEEDVADIVVFDYWNYDDQSGKRTARDGLSKCKLPNSKNSFSWEDIPNEICSTVIPTPWNKLFLRERIKELGLEYLPISTTNDITFATMAVVCARKLVYMESKFLSYRINIANSITSKKRDRLDNIITAVLSVDEQARKLDYYPLIRNSVRRFVASNLFVGLERYAGDEDSAQYTQYLKKLDSIFFCHPLFIDINEAEINNPKLFDKILDCRLRAMQKKDFSFAPELIVSMTSFPARINTVHIAIRSIFMQTLQPDRILLYLAKSQFPGMEADLPQKLLDYSRCGLEIRWCDDDIKSHKKYYYAMKEFPNALIVTVDDDLTYDPCMLEMLFASYLKYPYAVSAMRTHLMKTDNQGSISPYADWEKEYSGIVGVPAMQLFSTSGAGTLYPPYCMSKHLFDVEQIKGLCINADDIWLKVMQVLADTPVVLVSPNTPLRYIENTQSESLQAANVFRSENDIQLQRVLNAYDKSAVISKIFSTEVRYTEAETEEVLRVGVDISSITLRKENVCLRAEIISIRSSASYKVGRLITFIPRKIRGGIRCYKEHGIRYTLKRIKEKLISCFGKNR